MYKCMSCSSVFKAPKKVNFYAGYGPTREPDEHVCPSCGDIDFEPMKNCVLCGDAFEESSIEISIRQDLVDNSDEKCVCVKCLERLAKQACDLLKANMSDIEYKTLANYFDLSSKII